MNEADLRGKTGRSGPVIEYFFSMISYINLRKKAIICVRILHKISIISLLNYRISTKAQKMEREWQMLTGK